MRVRDRKVCGFGERRLAVKSESTNPFVNNDRRLPLRFPPTVAASGPPIEPATAEGFHLVIDNQPTTDPFDFAIQL